MRPDPNAKGAAFEADIECVLDSISTQHPEFVHVERHPRLVLQNDEVVIPDYHLIVELPFERSHYLIEVQNRARSEKDILHKIQHIRSKHRAKSFLFVFENSIPPETERALRTEGVMCLSAGRFKGFLERISDTIQSQPELPQPDDREDRAMLARPSQVFCYICQRSTILFETMSMDDQMVPVCWGCCRAKERAELQMQVTSTCPKCNHSFDWVMNKREPTPDGGTRPGFAPNCPVCRYDVTGSNERAPRTLDWHVCRDDLEGVRRMLRPTLRNLFGLIRPRVDARSEGEFTPLIHAAQNGNREMIALLLQHGADINAKTSTGKTALDMAVEYEHPGVRYFLVERGARKRS